MQKKTHFMFLPFDASDLERRKLVGTDTGIGADTRIAGGAGFQYFPFHHGEVVARAQVGF